MTMAVSKRDICFIKVLLLCEHGHSSLNTYAPPLLSGLRRTYGGYSSHLETLYRRIKLPLSFSDPELKIQTVSVVVHKRDKTLSLELARHS